VPFVDVTLTEGRDPDQVRALIHAVHQAVVTAAAARPEHVRVVVREVPRTHYASGDVTVAEMNLSAPSPEEPS